MVEWRDKGEEEEEESSPLSYRPRINDDQPGGEGEGDGGEEGDLAHEKGEGRESEFHLGNVSPRR